MSGSFTGNPVSDTILFIRYIWYFAWYIPWNTPFFFFPFTFGHLLYGFIIVEVICFVIKKMNQKGEYHDKQFWRHS